MAFQIDLNEAPLPSPRERPQNDAFASSFHVCSVCLKGVPAGRRVDVVTEEQRKAFKCLNCLLKSSGVREGGGGFDINASPPRDAEGDGVTVAIGGRRGSFGGGKTLASTQITSSSHRFTTRNPLLDNFPRTSSLVTDLASSGFQGMSRQMHSGGNFGIFSNNSSFDGGAQPNLTPSAHALDSPNTVYLNILREYIAERNGFLGEGWHVEFAFCDKRYKTSAVYIAPDGNRLKSMEDVARHLGLTPNNHCIETGNGISGISLVKSGVNIDATNKGYAANATAQNCIGDGIHRGFPVQFQDFCLMSAGNVDLRPSYHNTCQIFPVGYRSSWHDRITGSLFVCEIADGGDFGPIYKVYRYPCSKQSIPVSKTILSTTKLGSGKGDVRFGKDDLVAFQVFDDDSSSVMALLYEDSPPCLDATISERDNSSDIKCLVQRTGTFEVPDLNDVEFQVECRSSSSAWEKVSQAFLYAFHEKFKQNGAVKFFCDHGIDGTSDENVESSDSLSRYCYSHGPINIPPLVHNEDMFKTTCEKLYTWLNRDRFGLDADFVHEIIEKLPGVGACSEYKSLNLRKQSEALKTIGSGFFQAERRTSGTRKWSKLQSGDDIVILKRDPCPPGKSLNSKLPLNLIGDVLQVWELALRFLDVLGLVEPFSFQELESEILGASFGSYPNETMDIHDAVLSKGEKGSEVGLLLTKIISSLLKLLVSELLSKVAVYACPNLDVGEFKSRKGKKKDFDGLKKTKLDMLPVNELTWHEIARRYILAVLSMEGNLDSTDIASRESGKVFHCLQGDGGLLCGSLTGIAAFQADATVLADAMKHIFGSSLKSKNEIVSISGKQDACGDQKIELNDDDVMPEWTQALESVRKLPTNVGARIRKCVNEALEKNPPEWAKTILEHSISKEVYKGNASGPTKRAVVSVLDKVSKENPAPKREKKEKKRIKTNVTDLISKQCRVVLRRTAAADEERVFCNLLGRSTLSRNDNDDDEGLLGNPAMVSRPLDFRTIDLRLAAGVYDGSHEAFLDDVREVWSNVRTVYSDRSDLIDVAENLSQTFEDLYEKEVQTLVNKIVEASNDNGERDELLADMAKSSIPRAPWEEGICKTCGMDKDDDNVLLCDKCDSEYHRYCLNPPLLKIPEGNWFCPACVSGRSVPSNAVYGFFGNQNGKRKYQGEFVRKFLEGLAQLAKLMELKEFLEFTVDEKTYFLKFLFDEVLNTAAIHEHLEHCASRTTELQQKLRLFTSEMKILKFKEEMPVLNANADKENPTVCSGRAEVQSDASSSFLTNTSEALNQSQHQQLLTGLSQSENIFAHAPVLRRPSCKNDQGTFLSTNQATPGHNSSGSTLERQDDCPDIVASEDNIVKMQNIKNEISEMQKSIASAEQELVKVSLRKDFLGRDCNGRVYWAFHSHNARPWIIANGSMSSDKKLPEEFVGVPDSDKWISYETGKEIEELFRWLREDNVREKELKEAILQLQINKSKDGEYTERHVLAREETEHLTFSSRTKSSLNDSLASKALKILETKFGPCTGTVNEDDYKNLASGSKIDGKLFRCQCLELLWDSRRHCFSCHRTFLNDERLKQHSTDCKAAMASTAKRSSPTEDSSSRKKLKILISAGKIVQTTDNQNDGSVFLKHHLEPDCPFKLEEIMSRFVVPDSLKDEANGIGLIGSGGIPSFLPNGPSYFTDLTLTWAPTRINESNSPDMKGDFRIWSSTAESNTLSRSAENGLREREQVSSVGDNSSFYWLTRSSITSDSSSRRLVGRASEILRFLKINLLDMDAALPEDALRPSRSCQDRRCAWRTFVKSASSIYEMVEATLILEDAIKSNFLSSNWWYWSSPSTAAKISTLSALSLRIYALDSAICYEKPISTGASEEQNSAGPSSPPLQKTPELDPTEIPRTRSRASKRRKEI